MKNACRTLALVVSGALATPLLASGAASAATYTQHLCQKPGGGHAGRDGLSFSRSGVNTGVEDNCTVPGGALTAFLPDAGAGANYDPESYARWDYAVPPGSGLSVKRVSMGRGADGIGNGIRFAIFDRAGATRDFCTARGGFNGVVCPGFGSGLVLHDLGAGFGFGVFCPAAGGCSQPFADHRPEGRLDSLAIDLEDTSAPQITSPPAGTGLFDATSARQGEQRVSYTAQDSGGGLYRAVLRVDGQDFLTRAIDSNGGKCDKPFVHQVPCRTAAVNDSFTVDTSQIPDGRHEVQLVVRDATDVNQAVHGPVEITVDNVPPPSLQAGSRPTIEGSPQVGAQLTGQPGAWAGAGVTHAYQWQRCDADGGNCLDVGTGTEQRYTVSSRDAGARLRVAVTAASAEGSTDALSLPTPVIATPSSADPDSIPGGTSPAEARSPEDRGEANGAGASDRVRLSAFFGRERRTTIRTRSGRSARITGQLLDMSNNPIAGAVLTVMAEPRLRGARLEDLGSVRTDREGHFAYTAAAGPSRLIRIGYRSHANDSQFADTTDVTVLVSAGVTLRPRPQKLRNGSVATFAGKAARPLPARGVLVDLQVRVGKKWRTFAVVRTSRRGTYRFRHRFKATFVATTFRFRARIHSQADYPYTIGYSRIAKLKVRP